MEVLEILKEDILLIDHEEESTVEEADERTGADQNKNHLYRMALLDSF